MTNVNTPILYQELSMQLKPGQVIDNPVEMLTYTVDAALDRGKPDAVVLITSAEDAQKVMKWASSRHISLVPRGAGTGLSGGAVAENGGLILEFSRMNLILELDQEGRSAIVEPGVINQYLDETVKKAGLYYPPDPASGRACTIGGNIAENAGGPHCFKYGVTTNYLTGLEVVLADGRMIQFGGRALDYPEFDFVGLLAGSEGTLGVITKAYIRLLRNIPSVKTMMAAFNSVEDAGKAVSAVIAHGLIPSTMEMMDQKVMTIIENFVHAGLPVQASAALIIEVDGFPESLQSQMDEVTAILKENQGWDLRVAQSAAERDRIWYGRKSAIGAMARLAPSYLLQDGTVPRSRLAQTLAEINRICDHYGLKVGYVFHAGDGNLHPLILIDDPESPEYMAKVHQAGDEIMQTCVDQGGSITGEHGIGMGKRKYMRLMFNTGEIQAMQEIKQIFDPQGLLNPGKIFENLLTGDRYPDKPIHMPGESKSPTSNLRASSIEEAKVFIQQCLSNNLPVRVRGGGTKSGLLPGTTNQLETGSLKDIVQCDLDNLYITVQSGITLNELQSELAHEHMWVPLVSPWKTATIGGILAMQFNAPLRMRYGGLRDLVLSLKVLLPDGRLIHTGRPVVKNVAGYDLTKVFIGSYGSLGLITEITLKLLPKPRAQASLVVPVQDINIGLQWGQHLLKVCLAASSLLLLKTAQQLTESPYTLIYTAEGHPEDVRVELNQAQAVLQAEGGPAGLISEQVSGSQAWGNWIRDCLPEPGSGSPQTILARLGVAPKDLPGMVLSLSPKLDHFIADLANGMLYAQAFSETESLKNSSRQFGGYIVLLGGPRANTQVSPQERFGYESSATDLMQALKQKWDPKGLFNPAAFLV